MINIHPPVRKKRVSKDVHKNCGTAIVQYLLTTDLGSAFQEHSETFIIIIKYYKLNDLKQYKIHQKLYGGLYHNKVKPKIGQGAGLVRSTLPVVLMSKPQKQYAGLLVLNIHRFYSMYEKDRKLFLLTGSFRLIRLISVSL